MRYPFWVRAYRREDESGAECLQHDPSLKGHTGRHDKDAGVALRRSNHGQTDSSVSGCRLNDDAYEQHTQGRTQSVSEATPVSHPPAPATKRSDLDKTLRCYVLSPGVISPLASAPSISALPRRSLTEDAGFWLSSLRMILATTPLVTAIYTYNTSQFARGYKHQLDAARKGLSEMNAKIVLVCLLDCLSDSPSLFRRTAGV
jgi:hypothetical protein